MNHVRETPLVASEHPFPRTFAQRTFGSPYSRLSGQVHRFRTKKVKPIRCLILLMGSKELAKSRELPLPNLEKKNTTSFKRTSLKVLPWRHNTITPSTCTAQMPRRGRTRASSSNMTFGLRSTARQMATRCFCPPLSRDPRGPTSVSKPWLPFLERRARPQGFGQRGSPSVALYSAGGRPE